MNNLEKIFKQALPVEIENGINWYNNAHNTLKDLSVKYNIESKLVYAICSALSPRCTWNQNLNDTERVLQWFTVNNQSINKTLPVVTTYGHNLRKAISILETGNVDVFKTQKTYNFYHNIFNPNNPDYVTIDGHAINAYYGSLGKVENKHFTFKCYDKIAKSYKRLSKKYNLLPSQFQAVIWLAFKRIHNIKVNWRDYQTNLPF